MLVLSHIIPVIPLTMDGIEGHGLLLTRADQDQVYEEVRTKIALGGNFANWTPPTIVAQNRTRIQALVVANTNFYTQAARHPHTRAQDLTTIATNTTNPAVLVDIANNESADAGALAVVVNNANRSPASDSAVVANNRTSAASLTTIAGRASTLAADLKAIAEHQNVNATALTAVVNNANRSPASDTAVIANAHTVAADLVTIAGRTLLAADLHTITAHAHHNAASDTAVVGRANTPAADLVTIAHRTDSAILLAQIAAHGNANAAVLSAIDTINVPGKRQRV